MFVRKSQQKADVNNQIVKCRPRIPEVAMKVIWYPSLHIIDV